MTKRPGVHSEVPQPQVIQRGVLLRRLLEAVLRPTEAGALRDERGVLARGADHLRPGGPPVEPQGEGAVVDADQEAVFVYLLASSF